MTQQVPHPRFSFADMGKQRLYMLALDHNVMQVSVTRDHLLEVHSNFSDEQKPNAEEWIQEVALDISKAYGGKTETLYQMIKDGL